MSDSGIQETTFKDLKLAQAIQKALEEENYKTPTPIQAQSIPHLIEGRDLLGCAQTGTGKTAAFALPILHKVETERKFAKKFCPQVLVLSPTRELAAQISESFASYGRHLKFRQTVIYGGVNQYSQVRSLERGVHVAIATPGRLLDLMEQGYVHLDEMKTFVLDEADRMLDMGFLPDLKKIIAQLPEDRQSLFFSATMSDNVASLASSLLNNPVRVEISPVSSTSELIDQRVLFVDESNKTNLLNELLQEINVERMLIFTRTKRAADRVAQHINRSGLSADSIHGDKTQGARNRALADFKRGDVQILVATDIAARGIDVDGISHVINYDLPDEAENYVHRIGRTGRAGAKGMALSFCDASERGTLRIIERITNSKIFVELDHPYHSERASQSTEKSSRGFGRKGGNRGGGRGHGGRPQRSHAPRYQDDRGYSRRENFREGSEFQGNSHKGDRPKRDSSSTGHPKGERKTSDARYNQSAPKPSHRRFKGHDTPRPPRRGEKPRKAPVD